MNKLLLNYACKDS